MKKFVAAVAVLIAVLAYCPLPASAAYTDPFQDACNNGGGSGNASVCEPPQTTNPLTGKNGLILKIAKIIALFAGVTAIIVIIVSGMQFVTSNGDSNAHTKARNGVISALVGLVIIVLAQAIITFILNRI